MSDSNPHYFSPSRLSTYTKCPRLYEYKYEQEISTPDQTKRYVQQGRALHETIERVCESVGAEPTATEIHRTACQVFPDAWATQVDGSEFASAAQQRYYQRQAKAAMDEYLDPDSGAGIDHVRRSLAVERRLSCTHRGVNVYGYADNILETDTGLHIFDYKRNLRGMLTSGTADRLEPHLHGDEYEPKRVKNAMQAAVYIEGVKETELYESGMDVRFSFYGLLYDSEFNHHPDGYTVSARGFEREMTSIYEEHYETIWQLIEQAVDGVETGQYTPEPWELIREETCDGCNYQAMCADYIATEVR